MVISLQVAIRAWLTMLKVTGSMDEATVLPPGQVKVPDGVGARGPAARDEGRRGLLLHHGRPLELVIGREGRPRVEAAVVPAPVAEHPAGLPARRARLAPQGADPHLRLGHRDRSEE